MVAPRQRNTKEENKVIKEGKGDELWTTISTSIILPNSRTTC